MLPAVTSGWQLFHHVKVGVLPFLRSAALFFHYLNSTTPPAELLGNYTHSLPEVTWSLMSAWWFCMWCSCRSWSVGDTVQLPQSTLQPIAALPQPTHTAGATHTQVHTHICNPRSFSSVQTRSDDFRYITEFVARRMVAVICFLWWARIILNQTCLKDLLCDNNSESLQ